MSNRTLVELNHDFFPSNPHDVMEWGQKMKRYMQSGDPRELPDGVTFVHMRHHSKPCPVRGKV